MDINKLSGWGISDQIIQVVQQGFSYDEETGEVFFTTEDLDKLNMALDDKFEQLCGIHLMYYSDAESLKERAKEVDNNSKILFKKAEKIKKYIDALMKLNHKDNLKVGDKTIKYRKSISCLINDERKLREYIDSNDELKKKYYVYKAPELSKKALSDDIKSSKNENGEYTLEIPGVALVENNNIIIK